MRCAEFVDTLEGGQEASLMTSPVSVASLKTLVVRSLPCRLGSSSEGMGEYLAELALLITLEANWRKDFVRVFLSPVDVEPRLDAGECEVEP